MKAKLFIPAALGLLFSSSALADIPPPKEAPPADWSFTVIAAIIALLGAILFVWLGRKVFRRSQ